MEENKKKIILNRLNSENEEIKEIKEAKNKMNLTIGKKTNQENKDSKSLFSFVNKEEKDHKKLYSREGVSDGSAEFNISKSLSQNEITKQTYEYSGLTPEEIIIDLEERKDRVIRDLDLYVSEEYLSMANDDVELIFSSIIIPFSNLAFTEGFSVTKQILRRVEKILATEKNFYNEDNNKRMSMFREEITRYMPNLMLQKYAEIINKERDNPFSIYNDLLQDINAQDFVITGSFLNIQYKLNEYFYLEIPEYLEELNSLFVDHICTIYMYSRDEKFGPKDAIKDLEAKGFRFNFIYKSIVSDKDSIIFARKNTHGVAKAISDENYYLNLMSHIDIDDSEKEEIIEEMKKVARDNNFLIVGPTGSGKTTLLRQFLLDGESREQNLITIEDTKELNLPNAISYLTDHEYNIHDIFVSTLRMNPTRVVVGETRDRTILDILELCLTSKSATTLHATDMDKCVTRIRMMSKGEITSAELDYLITSAIDMFIFITDRRITGLYIRDKGKHFKEGEGVLPYYKKII